MTELGDFLKKIAHIHYLRTKNEQNVRESKKPIIYLKRKKARIDTIDRLYKVGRIKEQREMR